MAEDPTATTVPIQDTPNVANDGPTPPPAPQAAGPGTPPNGSTPPAPALPTDSRPPATLTPAPMVKPKRGGLAGVMDDLLDDIAGTKGQPKLTQGNDGNYYVETPALSRKGQWLKVASEALHGAAAGAAAKPGPGQPGRALEAGVNAGDKMAAGQQQQKQQMTAEARQKNQDNFNQIKLKHDMAAKEFELGRLKVQATESDVKFAQEQTDRMEKLVSDGKAFDLGTYKDEADLSRIKEVNPDFWKDVYKNDITVVQQIAPDGTRNGIRVFQTTPGIGNQIEPQGTSFKVFMPGAKPGDSPTIKDQVPTVPMTVNQHHAFDLAAMNQMQQWQVDQERQKLQASEVEANKAKATHEYAEARQLNEATSTQSIESNAQQMVEGTIDPSNLSKRSKSYDATLSAANAYSMQKYGQPFDLASAASDYKYSTNVQTQNTLKMIRGMSDPGGSIQIAEKAAKALPKFPEATINKIFNDTATEFGSKEATNFHTAMLGLADEYSKVMGAGSSSDTGRKQALELLKANYSKGQLKGAVDTMRQDIAARQKALVGTNRYLLRQYAPPRPQSVPENYVHRNGPNGIGWYAP